MRKRMAWRPGERLQFWTWVIAIGTAVGVVLMGILK